MSLRLRCNSRDCRKFHPVGKKKFCECGEQIPPGYWAVKKLEGKRHVKYLGRGTRTFAEHEHKKWLTELNHQLTAPPPQRLTLQEIADAYVTYKEPSGKRYAYDAKLYWKRLIKFAGNLRADELTVYHAQTWQTHLRKTKLSPATCDRHLEACKAAWNHCLRGVANPFAQVKLLKPDNVIIERLTPDEEERLFLAAQILNGNSPPHFREILVVAINTGLRRSNILHLHTSEVDFDHRVIKITQKMGRTHVVPMNDLVYEALLNIRPEGQEGYFFPPRRGKNKHLDDVRDSFRHALKLAGITRPFRFHGLRHHCASKLLKTTGNLFLVAKVLGHTDITTTQKYAHFAAEELRAAVDSLVGSPQAGATHFIDPLTTTRKDEIK